jgi:hypothetical protein
MNPIYRWLVWSVAAAAVVIFGFEHHWDPFHKFCLGVIIVAGLMNIIAPVMQKRMILKIKNMPPDEREKFLSRFDPKTQAKLRKHLEDAGGS